MDATNYAQRVHKRLTHAHQGQGIASVYEDQRTGETTHYGAPIDTAARVIRIVVMQPKERGQ